MARKALSALLTIALVLGIGRAQIGQAYAAPDKQPREVAALNIITGSDAVAHALKSLMDDKAKAKSLIAQALPLAKEKDQLRYNAALVLALSAAELKDVPASEAFFRVCIEQAAKLQSVSKLLQSFGGLTEIFYENKRYDDVTKLCQELINMKTEDGKERSVLFAFTKKNGEVDFFEDDSFKTTEPLLPYVFRQQVQAMAKQGKYDQAHKVLDNLIKQADDWRDRQLKGYLYHEAGQFEQAATAFNDLIERIKTDRTMKVKERALELKRNQYFLSGIYLDLKQVDKSADVLQELLKTYPNDPGYNNDLGYIWADHDMNLDEAERLIRKALEEDRKLRKADPETGEVGKDKGAYLDSLGWVLYKKKNLKEAKKILLEALEDKNAQHIEIYDHLGDVLLDLGERDGALEAWRTGLKHVTESRRDQERKKVVEEKLKKNAN
jgi:tetratricopeptide (TPR) repeat protein